MLNFAPEYDILTVTSIPSPERGISGGANHREGPTPNHTISIMADPIAAVYSLLSIGTAVV